MAQEVVQVAREAEPFFGYGQACDLLPCGPQLRDGGDLADERGSSEADGYRR